MILMYEAVSKGIEVTSDLKEEFEDLLADSATLQAKYISFCSAIHEEQKKVAIRAKEVWAEAMFTMGLEGKWRYEDGRVYPVDEPERK
jgi:hypothetical protein